MSFFIDTAGGTDPLASNTLTLPSTLKLGDSDTEEESTEVEAPSFVKKIFDNIKQLDSEAFKIEPEKKVIKKPNKKDINFDDECKNIGWTGEKQRGWASIHTVTDSVIQDTKNINDVLKKSVITDDFEKLHSLPTELSKAQLKAEKKREREKTKGAKWYGLPATELTEEVKHDLEVLQMRSVLDPKHFYKKNDLKVIPKYFQIGKVMDSPLDYYNNRCTRKERKRTLVDELLADAEFNKYNKRRYKQIVEEKEKTHYKAYKQARKLKKKNKK